MEDNPWKKKEDPCIIHFKPKTQQLYNNDISRLIDIVPYGCIN